MGEHLPCKQGVKSSILFVSTIKAVNQNFHKFCVNRFVPSISEELQLCSLKTTQKKRNVNLIHQKVLDGAKASNKASQK